MLSKKLKELRKSRGITQKELAEKMQISESAISLYEHNNRLPEYATLFKMAEYFDCSLDYLLGREEAEKSKDAPEGVSSDDSGLSEIEFIYQTASQDLRKTIHRVVMAVANAEQPPE